MTALSKVRGSQRALLSAWNCLQKSDIQPSATDFLIKARCQQTIASQFSLKFGSQKPQNGSMYTQSRAFITKSGDNIDEESGLLLKHPEKGILLYSGRMTKVVRNLKIVSLSTSLVSGGCQPLIVAAAKDDFMVTAGILSTMCLVVFSTPVLLHFVTRKYVTDIYYNEDTKIFTLARKSFFIRRKEVQYKAEDAKVSLDGGLFVTHKVKGQPYFIEYTDFRSKELYLHMVGYDKPLEYAIPDPNRHMKAKKFGLFENEEAAQQTRQSAPLRGNMSMLDDDDYDIVHKQPVKKNMK